jgi:glycosyltransferase involved in cell wall biosynthesis
MRIALVSSDALPTPPPAYGGLEAVVGALARDLVAMGHEVTLYALEGSPAGPYELSPLRSVHDLLRPEAEQRLLSHDVVHCHDWHGLAWELSRRHPRRTFCATFHGPQIGPSCDWTRPPPNLRLCGVSHWHAWSMACELGCAVQGVPNGVPLDAYTPGDGGRDDYLCVLARLDAAKGIDRAIELALHLGLPLRIAGPEWGVPSAAYVRSILARCDGRRLIWEGELGLERKVDLLRRAHCVLGLGDWPEPFGLWAVEANACGTPVVGLDRGALREVVGDTMGGIVVDDVRDLPAAVGAVADTGTCRQNAERYTVRAMAEGYLEVYGR